ncbi:MAG: CBS domain-containing protein [Rhodocyclaceae bacterium]|jgi:CBS domain-containing protein|nr:CBS domain-containing protein [Rhodocyclaceae bacterium]
MKSIRQILDNKTKPLVVVGSGDSVQHALELMTARDIGAVLVVDDDKLVGIFTERDCVHKVSVTGMDTRNTPVRDVMTDKVRFITPEQTVSEGLTMMTERFFRHLPVLDPERKLLGVVSIGDLVKEKISEQSFVIEQLENYITS